MGPRLLIRLVEDLLRDGPGRKIVAPLPDQTPGILRCVLRHGATVVAKVSPMPDEDELPDASSLINAEEFAEKVDRKASEMLVAPVMTVIRQCQRYGELLERAKLELPQYVQVP